MANTSWGCSCYWDNFSCNKSYKRRGACALKKIYRGYISLLTDSNFSQEENYGVFTDLSKLQRAMENLSKIRKSGEVFFIEELVRRKESFESVGEYRLVDGKWLYEDLEDFYTEVQ